MNIFFSRNIEGFENIREAVGDDIEIGVHCLWEFNFIDALNLARGLAPMQPKWGSLKMKIVP